LRDILGAKLSLTIGVLSFNEEMSLSDTHSEIQDALLNFPHPYEIILLDDGSTDGTGRISHELTAIHAETRSLSHRSNRGIGAAVKTIIEESTCTHILFVPGDNSYGAESLRAVATKMAEADVVVGKRGVEGVKRWRRMLSLGVRLSTRIWTYPNSFDSGGLNVYRIELIRSSASVENGYIFFVDTCMQIARRRPTLIFVPIKQKDGSGERSNSVKLGELVALLRVQRRMVALNLLKKK